MTRCTCDDFCDGPCPEHASEEEKAAWDGGLGDLGSSGMNPACDLILSQVPTPPKQSLAEELVSFRLSKWRSTVDARVVQVALLLDAYEYAAFIERGELPANYLTRGSSRYRGIPGVGKLMGNLVPDLDQPLTVESLVTQYEARAREVHKELGWLEEQWQGLAELWAVTDLEIVGIMLQRYPSEPPDDVLRRLFKPLSRGKLPSTIEESERTCDSTNANGPTAT